MKQHCHNCSHTFYTVPYPTCFSCPKCGWHHITLEMLMEKRQNKFDFPSCPHYDKLTKKLEALNHTNILTEKELSYITMLLDVLLQNPQSGVMFSHNLQSPLDICEKLGCKRPAILNEIRNMDTHTNGNRDNEKIRKRWQSYKLELDKCNAQCMFSASQFTNALSKFDISQTY